MAQARRRKAPPLPLGVQMSRRLREASLIVLATLAAYLLVALVSYQPSDPGWTHTMTAGRIHNAGGLVGAWFADVGFYLFGYLIYLFPVIVGYSGWLVYRGGWRDDHLDLHLLGLRWAGFALTVAAGCGLGALHFAAGGPLPAGPGGLFGHWVGGGLAEPFSPLGATLFLLALALTGITLFTGLSWFALMDQVGRLALLASRRVLAGARALRQRLAGAQRRRQRAKVVAVEKQRREKRQPPRIEPVIHKVETSERVERERQVPLFETPPDSSLPPLSLLDENEHSVGGYSEEALAAMSRQVELKLADFNVEARVVAVQPGPVITRFEIQPGPGVKVAQISNLSKDLARALSAISVRVVEVIPGKSVVGLEIPNQERELITLGEVLRSRQYEESASPLTLALGKDIGGKPVVADLARMPHLLVAGTTGSGKSVAINAMILSLVYKTLPRDVRLIMIDPKMLELSVYEGIPHLLAPVVTDMKEAANALRWCVAEMERRYRLMAALGVRNIGGFNRKVRDAEAAGEPLRDPLFQPDQALDPEAEAPLLESLPSIVVIVDELADLMMVVGKKIDELIARLAQKARAAGIHLVLATQRPSVDVITGLIKANIPTRIAFQVSSRVDSRTILDQMGAETLLGHGDMLYLPPGTAVPERVHGAFVSDQEVHRVVKFLKRAGKPEYIEDIVQGTSDSALLPGMGAAEETDSESDPLYDQAVRIVTESRRASISGVQRRLKIGYNRAARMIEAMEAAGIVGPLQSNGSREVLAPPPPED